MAGSTALEQPSAASADSAEAIAELDAQYVMGTYRRQPLVIERGEGAYVWDTQGRRYLDFLGGIAVVQVGHCHPRIADAIATQAHQLMHISNLFHNPLQAKLAKRLCGLTGMDKVFFCNSGAEANECALKIARKWGKAARGESCYEIVTLEGSFHGRTMGTVSATAQPKYQAPFAPLVPGFKYAKRGDIESLRELVTEKTCAVMVEAIQGESGIHPASQSYLKQVRELCDQMNVLLIFDEVQCGTGRTGTFLASQGQHVSGDIATMAKGIADGFPMGACLARGAAATTLVPGDHGSTFAGQPLACAAALATLDVLIDEDLMGNASRTGAAFLVGLNKLKRDFPELVQEVRGQGLMIGVEFKVAIARDLLQSLLKDSIIANATSDTVLRFVPPLCVNEEECLRVVHSLDAALKLISHSSGSGSN